MKAHLFSSKGFILLGAILLVVALIVVIIVTSGPAAIDKNRLVSSESFSSERVTVYSIEVQNEFRAGIKEFILDFMGVEDNQEARSIISRDVFNPLMNCFARAGISGEKAISLSNYLKDLINPDEVWNSQNVESKEDLRGIIAFLAFFSDVELSINQETGEENRTLVFNPKKYILGIFDTRMYLSVVNELTENTMLTYDEIIRLIYEIFFYDVQNESITRQDFVTVFRSFYFLGNLIYDFMESGGSLTQARLISELIYQSGSDMQKVLDKNTPAEILDILGFSSPFPSLINQPEFTNIIDDDSSLLEEIEKIDDVRALVTQSKDLMEFFIVFMVNAMLGVENIGLEAFARAQAPVTMNPSYYYYLGMISICRSVSTGMEKGFTFSEEITNKEEVATRAALVIAMARGIDEEFDSEEEMNNYKTLVKEELLKHLTNAEIIVKKYSNTINTVEDVMALSKGDLAELEFFYQEYTQGSPIILGTFDSILSTIFVNSMLNFYLNVYDLLVVGE